MAWEPARVDQLKAYRRGALVTIVATGKKPNPGYQVDIEQLPIRIFPPQFAVRWRSRPGMWPQVVVPYTVGEDFPYPEDEPTVIVHTAEGEQTVMIEDAPYAVSAPPARDTREATGYSNAWDLAEAMQDAISKLGTASDGGIADELFTYEVTYIGAEIGGIAGFHRMVVRVRG